MIVHRIRFSTSILLLCLQLCYLSSPSLCATIELVWRVHTTMGTPDCVNRKLILVNGQHPGPTIYANKGDQLIVHVNNTLGNEGVAIHWHGIHMPSTPYYDGIAGITQCPILPSEIFTYNITLLESGTYWWHGHTSGQRSEGLYGALVIYDTDAEPFRYDDERVVQLIDWFHAAAETQLAGLSTIPFQNTGDPQSLLINGRGVYNCSKGSVPFAGACVNTTCSYQQINVTQGLTYRFRIINVASLSYLRVQFSGHQMTIVEVDGMYVEPYNVTNLDVNIGERYSVLITMNQQVNNYWINQRTLVRGPTISGHGILHYQGAASGEPRNDFNALIRNDKPFNEKQIHQHRNYLTPVVDATVGLIFELSEFLDRSNNQLRMGINNKSFWFPETPIYQASVMNRDDLIANTIIYDYQVGDVLDIVIQARTNVIGQCETHPFHISGHRWWVLGNGTGQWPGWTTDTVNSMNWQNPAVRDQVTVFATSYMYGTVPVNVTAVGIPCGWTITRVHWQYPGIWHTHCHIDWHMARGMIMAFRIRQGNNSIPALPEEFKICGPAITSTL